MSKYRIVKATTEITKTVVYYIEIKRRFFKWYWWCRKTYYHPGYDINFDISYPTYEEAKKELDRLTEKTKVEVCS